MAGGPAEQNQSVAEIRPLFGRKTGGDFLLDFHGIRVRGPPIRPPTQSSGYAHHMRIDRESGDIECVAEHDVRGFAADSRQAGQSIHRARHHAAEPFVQCRGQSDEMLGFRTIEPQWMNDVFDLGRIRGRQVTSGGEGGEEFGVTVLTRLSVVWALSTVAISSSNGFEKCSAQAGAGITWRRMSYSSCMRVRRADLVSLIVWT